jgi:hypothetical protein
LIHIALEENKDLKRTIATIEEFQARALIARLDADQFEAERANAAWLRLALLTHNVLTALKRLALPPALVTARPKRLRFLVCTVPGRLITHARQLWLRLATTRARLAVRGAGDSSPRRRNRAR